MELRDFVDVIMRMHEQASDKGVQVIVDGKPIKEIYATTTVRTDWINDFLSLQSGMISSSIESIHIDT